MTGDWSKRKIAHCRYFLYICSIVASTILCCHLISNFLCSDTDLVHILILSSYLQMLICNPFCSAFRWYPFFSPISMIHGSNNLPYRHPSTPVYPWYYWQFVKTVFPSLFWVQKYSVLRELVTSPLLNPLLVVPRVYIQGLPPLDRLPSLSVYDYSKPTNLVLH